LADSLDTYARQIHSIAEIIRVIEAYGPNGERCWYSGEKPVFAKTR